MKRSGAQTQTPHHGGQNALLLLEDGTTVTGAGFGARGRRLGELCFNTAHSGYQEILTDPSYADQIITFTFPQIGNTGVNPEDLESRGVFARGVVTRLPPPQPSNWRARQNFNDWLREHDTPAIANIDTRTLTRRIRDRGSPRAMLVHQPDGLADINIDEALEELRAWNGLKGADLAADVSCREAYDWSEKLWRSDSAAVRNPDRHIVAVDFGVKRNILRHLADLGARVTVVPAAADAEQILAREPDGLFLSNGPGDPAATGRYAEQTLRRIMSESPALPIFGICLGHQILGRALGIDTYKMPFGHHGANHPVLEHASGQVAITSQNHNFCLQTENKMPDGVFASHASLFDGSNEGLAVRDRPVFSVQFHPEASPGPHDAHNLFARFLGAVRRRNQND
ncbi:MAG: glutamine-hydrolyzing carbamoyl-phosphate synthase small subunit [Alphaproteobacteria bacterium]|nr:glutamine-hydrolyzing carbamoyl-phosphate synthase small subunit [Alphaproteobacteria bacterium]